MNSAMRRLLERVQILRPRRGRQEVWDAIDRGELSPHGTRLKPGTEIPLGGSIHVADPSRVVNAELSAVVVRADGTKKPLGVLGWFVGK